METYYDHNILRLLPIEATPFMSEFWMRLKTLSHNINFTCWLWLLFQSICGLKLGCDVSHPVVAPCLASSVISSKRNWHLWNLLQHSNPTSIGDQSKQWHRQFTPARGGPGSSLSPTGRAWFSAAASSMHYTHSRCTPAHTGSSVCRNPAVDFWTPVLL